MALIDIGGGSGLLTHYFNNLKSITVLEPSKSMTKNIRDDTYIINSTIQDFNSKETFDIVLCFDSLHHFTESMKESFHERKMHIKKCIHKMITFSNKDIIIIEPNIKTFKGWEIKFQENFLFRMKCTFLLKEDYDEILEDDDGYPD